MFGRWVFVAVFLAVCHGESGASLAHSLAAQPSEDKEAKTLRSCNTHPYIKMEKVVHNNLGNTGPDLGKEGIFYQCEYVGSGDKLDCYFEVHAMSSYKPFASRRNGLNGTYGSINLEPGTFVELEFQVRDVSSGEPLELPDVMITFLDLDRGHNELGVEYVLVGGYDDFHLDGFSEVETSTTADGRTAFRASKYGKGTDNPAGDVPPNEGQRHRGVTLFYKNVANFVATIGSSGHSSTPRFFTFVSRFSLCAQPDAPWEAHDHQGVDTQSALYGRGMRTDDSSAENLGRTSPTRTTSLLWLLWFLPIFLIPFLYFVVRPRSVRVPTSAATTLRRQELQEVSDDSPFLAQHAALDLNSSVPSFKRYTSEPTFTRSPSRGGSQTISVGRAQPFIVVRDLSEDCGSDRGVCKWSSAVVVDGTLYCIPFHANDVLVVDLSSGISKGIDVNLCWNGKWRGATVFGGEIFAAPFNAEDVLIVSPEKNTVRSIATGCVGTCKWAGIAALGDRLYCAPHDSDDVLVIDPSTKTTCTIKSGQCGGGKWSGICSFEDKLYCAPFNSDDVLVIDPSTHTVATIATGHTGRWKWADIIVFGQHLYCTPHDADFVLVVDPEVGSIRTIGIGQTGSRQWMGIALLGSRLYCAPYCSDDVLVIDPEKNLTYTINSRQSGHHKWSGIAASKGTLHCAPFSADDVLEVRPALLSQR